MSPDKGTDSVPGIIPPPEKEWDNLTHADGNYEI
jgi:hypothetical protein